MQQPLTKKVNPVSTFRGDLKLGSLVMPITMYTKIMEAKPPAAKKWSGLAEAVGPPERGPTFGQVMLDRSYSRVQANEEAQVDYNQIDRAELIRAYRYGKDLIPFSQEDEEACRPATEKSMIALGFVKLSSIARHHYMSNPIAVMPMDDGKYFNCMIASLFELQYACVVRYCRTAGSTPKMGAIIHMKKGYGYFIHVFQFKSASVPRRRSKIPVYELRLFGWGKHPG